jgi:hypothetical protein
LLTSITQDAQFILSTEIISILDLIICSAFRDKVYNILMDSITYNEVKYFPIPNFDKYFISRCGKILSVKNKNPNILKHTLNNCGYKYYCLSNNNKSACKYLHRLLAITFLPDFSPELQVDHIDNNKLNNDLSNLRMVTKSDNQRNKICGRGVSTLYDKRNESFHYICYWYDDNGKRKNKSFSCKKYGDEIAFLMAHAKRDEMVDLYYNRPD